MLERIFLRNNIEEKVMFRQNARGTKQLFDYLYKYHHILAPDPVYLTRKIIIESTLACNYKITGIFYRWNTASVPAPFSNHRGKCKII